jgi:hypothetical protein
LPAPVHFYMGNAQVTLEKKYDYSTSVVEFETLGYKYYLMDVPNGQCRIYNMDHSLFKTINCNVPAVFFCTILNSCRKNCLIMMPELNCFVHFTSIISIGILRIRQQNHQRRRFATHIHRRCVCTTTSTKPVKTRTNSFRTATIFRFGPKRCGPTFTTCPEHRL